MPRADRLVRILSLLSERPAIGSAGLAQACRVSERTIFRDLARLSHLGIPIYFDRGYRTHRPSLLPPLHLDGEEALALKAAAIGGQGQRPPGEALRRGLAKLEELLTRPAPRPSADPSGQIPLDLPPTDGRERSLIPSLEAAIAARRTVLLEPVGGRTQGAKGRAVDPYGVAQGRTGFVLIGYCHRRRRMMSFSLDGVRAVSVTRKRFRPRPERAVARVLDRLRPRPGPPPASARIRFWPPAAQSVALQPPPGTLEVAHEGGGAVVLTVAGREAPEILSFVLGHGGAAEILEPADLRRQARHLAERMVASHREQP